MGTHQHVAYFGHTRVPVRKAKTPSGLVGALWPAMCLRHARLTLLQKERHVHSALSRHQMGPSGTPYQASRSGAICRSRADGATRPRTTTSAGHTTHVGLVAAPELEGWRIPFVERSRRRKEATYRGRVTASRRSCEAAHSGYLPTPCYAGLNSAPGSM